MSIERGTNKRRTTTRRVIGILLACVTLACATPAEALTPRRGTLKTRSVLNGIRRDQLGFPTRIPKGFAVGMTERGTSGRLREREIDFATLRAKGLVEESSGNPIGAASGYFALNSTQDAHMFYTYFPVRSTASEKKDPRDYPVIIWLTGGPGCSSELAIFYENGPYGLSRDEKTGDLALREREFSWNDAGNVIFVDSPVGTGFSYSGSRKDAAKDEKTVANDLLEFLQEFLVTHPELADNDVYVTGESYAGHYVPAFAHRIFEANKSGEGPVLINLRGFAIGNGLTDPMIQYGAYTDYSIGNDIVSEEVAKQATEKYPECARLAKECADADLTRTGRHKCMDAVDFCMDIPETLLEDAARRNNGVPMNVYDIRKSCDSDLCYDFSDAEKYLNLPEVQKALGVSKQWTMCDPQVHQNLMADWMRDYEPLIPPMLEGGIRAMIYAGENDFICNWLGNLRWVKAMEWSGQKGFNGESPQPFVVDQAGETDVIGGEVREYGLLSFVKISQAGHMVPMDQPRNALTMIERFVQGASIARGEKPVASETR
jgi:serine carboxypeptidase-like clade 4